MHFRVLFVLGLLAAVASVAGAANIVQDPGFESGGTGSPWVQGGVSIVSAVTQFGTIGPLTGTYFASGGCVGSSCITDWNGTTGGSYIYQDLTTTPGASYTIGFWFYGVGVSNELKVLFGSTTVVDLVNPGNTEFYRYYSGTATASGSTTRLVFLDRQDPSWNGIDDVSVDLTSAVPEPASWVLVAGSLAGILAYRRKRRA